MTPEGSGSAAALADDAATLTFGGAAPNPLLLPGCECVLQARDAYVALFAHGLGSVRLVLLIWVEHPRIEPTTGP